MAATGSLGATLNVGTAPLASIGTPTVPLVIANFQGLGYTNVGTIESLGNFGRMFETVTFNSLSDGRTLKLKGPYNDGQLQMGLGADLSDAGQALLFTYGTTLDQNTYPIQVQLVGAPMAFTFVYFGGKVMSYQLNVGQANSVLRAQVNIEVNTTVFFGSA